MEKLRELAQNLLIEGYEADEIVEETREAVDAILAYVPDGEQPRFNYQQLCDEFQLNDIKDKYQEAQLYGIVDESKGGFIGYAISEEHAELISKALIIAKGQGW